MEPISLFEYESLRGSGCLATCTTTSKAARSTRLLSLGTGGALDETLLSLRVLVDVTDRDLSTTVLGASSGVSGNGRTRRTPASGAPGGERATARAAATAGTVMSVPTASGYSLEEIAEAARGPLWLQLYHFSDELTELLVRRAEAAGYSAIVLTVDAPVRPLREHDLRNRFVPDREMVTGSLHDYGELLNAALLEVQERELRFNGLVWSRLAWLRRLTSLPLVVKGIMGTDDAVRCADHAVDAIVVSNHGGRTLTESQRRSRSCRRLPMRWMAVWRCTWTRVSDAARTCLRALALGARAVLIGRPLFWGLTVDGEAGVLGVLRILREEFDRAMAYCGFTDVTSIERSAVVPPR